MAAKSKRGPKPRTAHTAPRPAAEPSEPRDGASVDARPPGRWDPPAHLSGDAEALAAWRHAVEMIGQAGNLDRTDPTLVEAYAVNVSLLRAARSEVQSKGVLVENRFGADVPNPALAVVNSATMRLKAIIGDLGLCPASSKYAAAATGAPPEGGKWDGLLGVVG